MIRPPHDSRNAPASFERGSLLTPERCRTGVGIGIEPGAVVGGHDHDRIGCNGPDGIHDLADISVHLHQRVRVVPEMGPAGEVGRRIGRVVHLEEIDVHEERLVVVGVLLDVVDGVGGLLLVESGKSLVGDLAEILGRLAGHAFPFVQVHVFAEDLGELRIIRREPGMEPLVRVVVGIDAGIVGGEILHLVEAMLDRIGLGLVAQMPFAGEVRRVAVLLKELGDRRRLLAQGVFVARRHHDRQGGADRNASGHERGTAGGATRLAIPVGENGALLGDAIDIRCRMAEARASSRIATEIIPTGVVGHQHDDVGFHIKPHQARPGGSTPGLLVCRCWRPAASLPYPRFLAARRRCRVQPGPV